MWARTLKLISPPESVLFKTKPDITRASRLIRLSTSPLFSDWSNRMPKPAGENWDEGCDSDTGDEGSIPEEDEFTDLVDKEFATRYTKFLGRNLM
jgi:hypothetical protein